MGQIVSSAAKPKRCNANQLSQVPTPAAGEHILVSSDNSMNAAGQGNFDAYVVGNGRDAATALPLHYLDAPLIEDEEVIVRALMKHEDRIADIEEQMAGSDGYMGEDEELTIARALVDLKENGGGESGGNIKGAVDINNSDTIAILGASFTDGSTPAKGKDWTSILSALTDYNYHNYSRSGSNLLTNLNRARGGDFKGKYALMTLASGNGVDSIGECKMIPILCETLESYGIKPIMCSPYCYGASTDAFFKEYAKKKNYYFFPCAEYYELTSKGRSLAGDNGWHLGTMSIGVWSNGYMVQAPYIDRPTQSLKIFRIRTASASKTLDELVFKTNVERFENFYELYFGQLQGGDEYGSISSGVTFEDKALVSCVLPINASNLKSVGLKLQSTSNLKVYVLNRIASPYPSSTAYARFSVENEITLPSVGAVYSDGSSNYTVVSTILGENGMYATIYCTPNISTTGGAGTLTKVSGTGASSISYSMVESATLSTTDAVNSDNGGHWEELTANNGVFELSSIYGRVHIDKVHFLIECSGEFVLTGASVVYAGIKYKEHECGHVVDFDSNEYQDVTEYIQEPTFGTTGNILSHWVDSNNASVVSQSGYDNRYIFDSSVVMLSDIATMKQSIQNLPKGRYYLEVMARFSHENITEDSYDFNDLFVEIQGVESGGTHTLVLSDKVGLYPTICRFPIDTGNTWNGYIKLYSTSRGVEIFKVSLKKY